MEVFVVYPSGLFGPGPPFGVCTSSEGAEEIKDDTVTRLVEATTEGPDPNDHELSMMRFDETIDIASFELGGVRQVEVDEVFVVYPDSLVAGTEIPFGVYLDRKEADQAREELVADRVDDLDEAVATPGKTLRETVENQIHVERFGLKKDINSDN